MEVLSKDTDVKEGVKWLIILNIYWKSKVGRFLRLLSTVFWMDQLHFRYIVVKKI